MAGPAGTLQGPLGEQEQSKEDSPPISIAATPTPPLLSDDEDGGSRQDSQSKAEGQLENASTRGLNAGRESARRVADFIKGKAEAIITKLGTTSGGGAGPSEFFPSESAPGPAGTATTAATVLATAASAVAAHGYVPLPPKERSEDTTTAAHSSPPESATSPSQQQAAALDKLYAAAAGLGRRTKEGGVWAYQATAAQLKTLTQPRCTLRAICKADAARQPVPQAVLACCSAIAAAGLHSPGIFKEESPAEQLSWVCSFVDAGCALLPPGVEPLLAANALKHFLSNLEEPVLVGSLAGRWAAAGEDPEGLPELLAQLPPAHLSTFRVLLDVCYRVAANSSCTGMNAYALAQQLAPVLLWKVAEPSKARSASAGPAAAAAVNSLAPSGLQARGAALATALRARLNPSGSQTLPISPLADPVTAKPQHDASSATTEGTEVAAPVAGATGVVRLVTDVPSPPVADAVAAASGPTAADAGLSHWEAEQSEGHMHVVVDPGSCADSAARAATGTAAAPTITPFAESDASSGVPEAGLAGMTGTGLLFDAAVASAVPSDAAAVLLAPARFASPSGSSLPTAAATVRPAAAAEKIEGVDGAVSGAVGGNGSARVAMEGEELELVVRALEHLIVLYEDFF